MASLSRLEVILLDVTSYTLIVHPKIKKAKSKDKDHRMHTKMKPLQSDPFD